MNFLKNLVRLLENKTEEIPVSSLLFYFFGFLYLRQILEVALSWNYRVGSFTVFWESLRLLILDYPIFYLNVFLLLSLFLSAITREKVEKILKVMILFTPITLIPPLYDFIFQGGGFRYYYLLNTFEILKNLFADVWTQYKLGFSRGQVIEIIFASVLCSMYIFAKGRKILAFILLPLPFFLIIFLGSPYLLVTIFLKNSKVFGDFGFMYYNYDKILVYNLFIFILITRFFKFLPFRLSLNLSPILFFALFGWLTAWYKVDFISLSLFDAISLPLILFIISIKRENIFSYIISIILSIPLSLVPFIFLLSYFLFEKTFLSEPFKDFFLTLFAFYAGAGFFLKTRVHLAYPFYYPLLISSLILIIGLIPAIVRYRWVAVLLLPVGFFFKTSSLITLSSPKNTLFDLKKRYEYTKNPGYLYDLWSINFMNGNIEEAKRIVQNFPFHYSPADYYTMLCDLLLYEGKFSESESLAKVSKGIGNPFYLFTLGEIYMEKDIRMSLPFLEEAHKRKIEPLRSFFSLGRYYIKKKQIRKAQSLFKEMKRVFPHAKTIPDVFYNH